MNATAQYCPPGAATACTAVLIVALCSTEADQCEDIRSTLRGTGAFATVDIFDASSAAPAAAQLAAYHAVLVCSAADDAGLLGDRLAAYHDQGGGVVVTFAANMLSYGANLQGAYGAAANGYALMDYASGGYVVPSDSLGDVLEPQSPLMAGVASLAATHAYRSTAPVIAGRGVVVARWGGGGREPLVLRGQRGNRTLVELNFLPVSSNFFSAWWTGDGALLLRNALKYSRCMPCGPGTFAAAGAQCRWWGNVACITCSWGQCEVGRCSRMGGRCQVWA